jgi:hypothetical protein
MSKDEGLSRETIQEARGIYLTEVKNDLKVITDEFRNDLKNEIRAELDDSQRRFTASIKRINSLLERLDALEPGS